MEDRSRGRGPARRQPREPGLDVPPDVLAPQDVVVIGIRHEDQAPRSAQRVEDPARRLECPLIFHRDGEPIREFRKAWASA